MEVRSVERKRRSLLKKGEDIKVTSSIRDWVQLKVSKDEVKFWGKNKHSPIKKSPK